MFRHFTKFVLSLLIAASFILVPSFAANADTPRIPSTTPSSATSNPAPPKSDVSDESAHIPPPRTPFSYSEPGLAVPYGYELNSQDREVMTDLLEQNGYSVVKTSELSDLRINTFFMYVLLVFDLVIVAAIVLVFVAAFVGWLKDRATRKKVA